MICLWRSQIDYALTPPTAGGHRVINAGVNYLVTTSTKVISKLNFKILLKGAIIKFLCI